MNQYIVKMPNTLNMAEAPDVHKEFCAEHNVQWQGMQMPGTREYQTLVLVLVMTSADKETVLAHIAMHSLPWTVVGVSGEPVAEADILDWIADTAVLDADGSVIGTQRPTAVPPLCKFAGHADWSLI